MSACWPCWPPGSRAANTTDILVRAVLVADRDMTVNDIANAILERYQRDIDPGAIFASLERMTKAGNATARQDLARAGERTPVVSLYRTTTNA
jgi:DNA-binding PadR family transcriptional regulator